MAQSFANIIRHQTAFVLGSAPGANLDACPASAVLVACNGSIAPFAGLVPDVLIVNGFTTLYNDAVAQASMAALRGRHVRHLVLISNRMSFADMQVALAEAGLTWDSCEEMTQATRRAVVETALGRPVLASSGQHVASTGVTAILWAHQCGASTITVSGFSAADGHSYIPGETPRNHSSVDVEALAAVGMTLT